MSDMTIKFVSVSDHGLKIEFDVVDAEIEITEGDYHYDEYDIVTNGCPSAAGIWP